MMYRILYDSRRMLKPARMYFATSQEAVDVYNELHRRCDVTLQVRDDGKWVNATTQQVRDLAVGREPFPF